MLKDAWDQRRQQAAGAIQALRKELKDIDNQTDKLLERIIESDSPAVTSAYEKKIVQLERRKLLLDPKGSNRATGHSSAIAKCSNSRWVFSQALGRYGVPDSSSCVGWCCGWPLSSV